MTQGNYRPLQSWHRSPSWPARLRRSPTTERHQPLWMRRRRPAARADAHPTPAANIRRSASSRPVVCPPHRNQARSDTASRTDSDSRTYPGRSPRSTRHRHSSERAGFVLQTNPPDKWFAVFDTECRKMFRCNTIAVTYDTPYDAFRSYRQVGRTSGRGRKAGLHERGT